MKKIELHCHLDGSLSVAHASKLLGRDALPEMIAEETTSPADYLEKFTLPLQLLQTKKNLTEFARLLALDLAKDDVIYAEIRFCPMLHRNKHLSAKGAVMAVLEGLRKVPSVKTNLILCMMRDLPRKDNEKIVDLAAQMRSSGVCAIDLAGDEAAHPNSEFTGLFQMARVFYRLPLTIHGGEAADYQSVEEAINAGASRIGHGVRAIESEKTVQRLIAGQIPLEICPTSNIDTGIYPDLRHHPIRQLLDVGVPVTINTDNRTVSHTSLDNEYAQLRESLGFTDEDFLRCNLNAALGSFAKPEEKIDLCRQLIASYTRCRTPS